MNVVAEILDHLIAALDGFRKSLQTLAALLLEQIVRFLDYLKRSLLKFLGRVRKAFRAIVPRLLDVAKLVLIILIFYVPALVAYWLNASTGGGAWATVGWIYVFLVTSFGIGHNFISRRPQSRKKLDSEGENKEVVQPREQLPPRQENAIGSADRESGFTAPTHLPRAALKGTDIVRYDVDMGMLVEGDGEEWGIDAQFRTFRDECGSVQIVPLLNRADKPLSKDEISWLERVFIVKNPDTAGRLLVKKMPLLEMWGQIGWRVLERGVIELRPSVRSLWSVT